MSTTEQHSDETGVSDDHGGGRWRELVRRRTSPGGLTVGAFLAFEVVCTGTLVTAVIVAAV